MSRSEVTKSLPYLSGRIFVVPRTVTFVPLMAGGERDMPIVPPLSALTWYSLAQTLENVTRERLPGLCHVSGQESGVRRQGTGRHSPLPCRERILYRSGLGFLPLLISLVLSSSRTL